MEGGPRKREREQAENTPSSRNFRQMIWLLSGANFVIRNMIKTIFELLQGGGLVKYILVTSMLLQKHQ